jgi:hypothetical protein
MMFCAVYKDKESFYEYVWQFYNDKLLLYDVVPTVPNAGIFWNDCGSSYLETLICV